MFGYHAAKREKKRALKALQQFKQQKKQEAAKPAAPPPPTLDEQVASKTQSAKQDRATARQEGKAYAEEVLNRDVKGLTDEQKRIMQNEANQQIKRAELGANRRILSEHGLHGIGGKSGVAYAQQRDAMRLANEARGQANRDLQKLDADQRLKNLAAMFNIEQGEAAQAQLDKQMAVDELQLGEERKKQKYWEDQFNRLFSRV